MAFIKRPIASTRLWPGKRALVSTLLVGSLVSSPLQAQLTQEERDWIAASPEKLAAQLEQLQETIEQSDLFANPHMAEARAEAQEIHDADPTVQRLQAAQRSQELYADHTTLIFVSESIEHTGLQDVLEIASGDPSIMIIFRGIPDDMKLDEGVFHYQQMAAEFDPLPNIALDPTLFEFYGVDVVPTIVHLPPLEPRGGEELLPDINELLDDDASFEGLAALEPALDHREPIAVVRGLTDPAWLERQVRHGQTGDLGIQGPVEEIQERDLIELMQERAMAIDWEQQKQGAEERFWSNQQQQMNWLPAATQTVTRDMDPHVLVTSDIADAEGNVITPAGTRINPLEIVPFRLGLIIFDATDPKQVELALSERERLLARDEVRETILMTTQLDTSSGWDQYTALSNELEQALFLLTPDVRERFEIGRVPTIVEPGDNAFRITEVALLRDVEQPESQEEEG